MSEVNARLTAALSDRYTIDRELGRGGMATVYLAHDIRHDRDVAIKVLHEDLGATLGPERFLAEIKTTAKLQHPHILPLLDSGDAGGFLFYVMPYVEGETLRDRLTRETQLPIEDAVRVAREVADALGFAHAHGIVHRDIKPENILLQGGHALVADFGIALAVQHAGGARLTQTGLSLGTPQYMAPEQAMGEKTVDDRADIYALGAVTYEMLTGEPPFTGASVQAIVAKVLSSEPAPLTTTRKMVPPHVEAAVLKALAKLPADRWATAGQFSETISGALGLVVEHARSSTTPHRRSFRERVSLAIGAVGIAAIAVGGWLFTQSRDRSAADVLRHSESFDLLEVPRQEQRIAISPDGRQLAFVVADAEGRPRIEVRNRSELLSTVVAGTEGAISVFFSPDGTQLGFLVDNPLSLKVVRPGGPVAVVAPMKGGSSGGTGGYWGEDGWIYVSGPGFRIVQRYRPDGTSHDDLTQLDTLHGEWWQGQPFPLPHGNGVLFTIRMRNFDYQIAVADLRTKTHRLLGVPGARAVLTSDGFLLVVAEDGTLRAARFDEDKLTVVSPFVPVASGLRVRSLGMVNVGTSESGTLLYELVDSIATTQKELVWVTRSGSVQRFVPPALGNINNLEIAPDGERVALEVDGRASIWRLGVGVLARSRLTEGTSATPSWMPDGRRLSFTASSGGKKVALFARPADGSATQQLLLDDDELILDARWSRSGGWVAYREFRWTLEDIFAARPGVDTSRVTVAATPFNESSPAFAPDGQMIAYTSDESGTREVYVRSFPNVQTWRVQVSESGGFQPIWDPTGRSLYYLDLDGAMWSADLSKEANGLHVQPHRLFETASWRGHAVAGRTYDISPKDGRFLMVRSVVLRPKSQIVFVEGFSRELRQRLVK